MEEVKERILKTTGGKVNYKGTPISLSADFSTEMLQARQSGKVYSKSWKGKICNLEYYAQQDYHLEKQKLKKNTAILNLS